jgi:hypothetical protein
MGNLVCVECQCGFKEKFGQGGGMMSFQKYDMEPAICLSCKTFTVVNYKDKNVKCEKCGKKLSFYNDPKLTKNKDAGKIQWSDFYLPMKNCLCPKCGKYTLEFKTEGNFD